MENKKINEEKLIRGETIREFICPYCGKQNFVFAGFQKLSKKMDDSGFNLWNCSGCKSTFGEPTIDKKE